MFELVTGTRRRQPWGDRCIALSGWERLGRAFFWGCMGSCVTMIVIAIGQLTSPVPPVTLLDPVIEHTTDGYSAYRLRMQWRGTEKSCDLYIFHDRLTWRLTCDPR